MMQEELAKTMKVVRSRMRLSKTNVVVVCFVILVTFLLPCCCQGAWTTPPFTRATTTTRGSSSRRQPLLHPSSCSSNKEKQIISAARRTKHNDDDRPEEQEAASSSSSLFGWWATEWTRQTSRLVAVLLVFCVFLSIISNSSPALADNSSTSTDDSSNNDSTTTSTVIAAANIDNERSPSPRGRRYYDIQANGSASEKIVANTALIDYAVDLVQTQYYDATGGAVFCQRDFVHAWRSWLHSVNDANAKNNSENTSSKEDSSNPLATREGAVATLRALLRNNMGGNDPYTKYLTRQELWEELHRPNEGFLGLGAMVEAATDASVPAVTYASYDSVRGSMSTSNNNMNYYNNNNLHQISSSVLHPSLAKTTTTSTATGTTSGRMSTSSSSSFLLLHPAQVQECLPVVTAVAPNSPAERAGLTVGDRIVAVGDDVFSLHDRKAASTKLKTRYSAENYLGYPDLTVAKPVYAYPVSSYDDNDTDEKDPSDPQQMASFRSGRDVILAYRPTRVRLPTVAASSSTPMPSLASESTSSDHRRIAGGDAVVQYELLLKHDQTSIFDRILLPRPPQQQRDEVDENEIAIPPSSFTARDTRRHDDGNGSSDGAGGVGYIRLTRFSRQSTAGFLRAVDALEEAGATSYIIDLRNNYGGVIQEALLQASTLLRDPHMVLCYTMNARDGSGLVPHDVEEFVVDPRYPGYLLSTKEPKSATRRQVQRENPQVFQNWSPPSSYASLREQTVQRGIHRPSSYSSTAAMAMNTNHNNMWSLDRITEVSLSLSPSSLVELQQVAAQKNLVILVNEGTASSAEVFASALHDNGRTVALVGTKTYGKGLIQHTFPMPDGGGLPLTVAEYLTPALHHVTHVGDAQFDRLTGEWIGSGIQPDVVCDSRQGIPSNKNADLCVGVALDVLQEAEDLTATTTTAVMRATPHERLWPYGGGNNR